MVRSRVNGITSRIVPLERMEVGTRNVRFIRRGCRVQTVEAAQVRPVNRALSVAHFLCSKVPPVICFERLDNAICKQKMDKCQ